MDVDEPFEERKGSEQLTMEKEQTMTRGRFVGLAAAAGAVLAAGGAGVLAARADEAAPESTDAAGSERRQMGFWVNTENCVDCGTCAHACRRANDTPEDVACRRKILIGEKRGGVRVYVSVSCMHCADPTCLKVCPAGAIYKRAEDGIVAVDQKRCIGCKYCYQACPFEVPHYTSAGMDKCDYCTGNGRYPDQGPACAEACPHDALHWGDIQELLLLAGGKAKAVSAVTGPSFIVS